MKDTILTTDPYLLAYVLLQCAGAEVVSAELVGLGWDRLTFTVIGVGVAAAEREFKLEEGPNAIFANQYKAAILNAFRILRFYKQTGSTA